MKKNMLPFACIICVIMCLTSCFPKYASKDEINEYVTRQVKGESVYMKDELGDNTYLYCSNDRSLTFTVGTKASKVYIDGADFGYTGQYDIYSDYDDAVMAFHENKVYDLLEECGLSYTEKSTEYKTLKNFKFCIPESYNEDIKKINIFVEGLKEIIREEESYHSGKYFNDRGMYTVEVYIETKNGYRRTTGLNTSGYYSYIYEDTEFDIQHLHVTDMYLSNIIPPVRDGLLIYIK